MLISPAYAQAAGAPAGPGLLEALLPFVLIFVIMYFLIIRPQQKKAREHREMLEALRRGDEVITAGGLLGKVTKVKEDDEEVEIELGRAGDQPVRVRVIKATISAVTSKTQPAGGGKKGEGKAAKGDGKTENKSDKSAANDDRKTDDEDDDASDGAASKKD